MQCFMNNIFTVLFLNLNLKMLASEIFITGTSKILTIIIYFLVDQLLNTSLTSVQEKMRCIPYSVMFVYKQKTLTPSIRESFLFSS